jgi:hypothetical protein
MERCISEIVKRELVGKLEAIEDRCGMITTEFKCPKLKAKWEQLCSRVLDECKIPPTCRIVCYFDDESKVVVPSEGGLFVPDIRKSANRECWPPYVGKHLSNDVDALIYISGYTCCADDEVFFVMALAHELRHLVQWATFTEDYRDNKKVEKLSPPVLTRKWDLPVERDSMIFSKRVAVAIFGPDVVNEWTTASINTGDGHSTPYCEVFPEDYDWVEETRRMLQRHQYAPNIPE